MRPDVQSVVELCKKIRTFTESRPVRLFFIVKIERAGLGELFYLEETSELAQSR